MPSLHEIRNRCRTYARKFNYPEVLFNRIPTYIFQYFGSNDPLDRVPGSLDQMDIMNIFMIINGISADIMMAFYAAADQPLETVLRIHEYFCEYGLCTINRDQPIELPISVRFSHIIWKRELCGVSICRWSFIIRIKGK